MTQKLKQQLVNLISNRLSTTDTETEYREFVVENIDKFDTQAWDIFLNSVLIDSEQIVVSPKTYWGQIAPAVMALDPRSFEDLGTQLRVDTIQTLLAESQANEEGGDII